MSFVSFDNMKITDPKHWTNGGTAITNFDVADKELYEKAIAEYGDETLYISNDILCADFSEKGTMLCLHHNSQNHDLSDFWKLFNIHQNNQHPPTPGEQKDVT
jgi:hypothetical protein